MACGNACFLNATEAAPSDARAVVIIANVLSSSSGMQSQMNISAVFLDRDGVINEKMPEGQYVRSELDLRILPGVPRAIATLNEAGIRVLVVSNQRGVSLGLMSSAAVDRIHMSLQKQLRELSARIDGMYYCPHDKNSCTCRKPLPGLFEQALRDFPDIEATRSVMIGDSFSDIEFGYRLGMETIWIQGGSKDRKSGWERAEELADWNCSSLEEAVNFLLGTHRQS